MTINKDFNNDIWDILQKIKGKISLSKKLKIIWKQQNNHNDFNFEKGEEFALSNLKKLRVIKTTIEPAPLFPEHLAGYTEAYTYQSPEDKVKILYLIINQVKFNELYKEYEELIDQNMDNKENGEKKENKNNEKTITSLRVITDSIVPSVIFLVVDENFNMPIRYNLKNHKGEPTAIKMLFNIIYPANVPGKKVNYNKKIADNINNGLFKKREFKKYIETNKFKKPTLVQKSETNTLVLKNDIIVKPGLIEHDIPTQYKSLYIDKTM